MKRILGVILSTILICQGVGVTNVAAATKHRHSYTTVTEGIQDNNKHRQIKKCTTCGYILRTVLVSHVKGDIVGYKTNTEKKHYVEYKCKKCSETFTREASHKWEKISTVKKDETYHAINHRCKDCGQTKEELKKHTYSKGICRQCGHNKSQGVTATTQNKSGYCYSLLGKWFNDNWVYAKCPSCNSSNWTMDYVETIGKTRAVWSGYMVVKHQHVKCSNCGKKYTNKCYYEHE